MLSPAHGEVTTPILMTSQNVTPVSGIAWTNIDSSCRLSYNVRLEGLQTGGGHSDRNGGPKGKKKSFS